MLECGVEFGCCDGPISPRLNKRLGPNQDLFEPWPETEHRHDLLKPGRERAQSTRGGRQHRRAKFGQRDDEFVQGLLELEARALGGRLERIIERAGRIQDVAEDLVDLLCFLARQSEDTGESTDVRDDLPQDAVVGRLRVGLRLRSFVQQSKGTDDAVLGDRVEKLLSREAEFPHRLGSLGSRCRDCLEDAPHGGDTLVDVQADVR